MEEKEMSKFSWSSLFFVTGFCFFTFSGILKVLGDYQNGFFIWGGSVSLLFGLISWAGKFIVQQDTKNRRNLTS
jgi:hypothetical protein